MIYLDYAATTPMSEQALSTYTKVAREYYGNANSLHEEGTRAQQIVTASKQVIAQSLGASARHVHFVSGATEGNFLTIYSLLESVKKQDSSINHILCSPIEHDSVLRVMNRLKKQGWEIEYLPLLADGRVCIDQLKERCTTSTALIAVQLVNSELGTYEPVEEIAQIAREMDIKVHCDAVQAFGKIPIDVHSLGVHSLSISAHKIYGPQGIGAVWLSPHAEWSGFFPSSSSKKFRPGTLAVPSIAAFAAAAREAIDGMDAELIRIQHLREAWVKALHDMPNPPIIEGADETSHQSPYILGLRFPGLEGQFLMLECDQAGVGISTGSACQSGMDETNVSMKALGKSEQEAREFVRLSFGKGHYVEEIPQIIEEIRTIVDRHYSHKSIF
tara:strand:- start:36394 stop:37554 length:1161 start_codon:yes stop_codon:yes gene_type:complete